LAQGRDGRQAVRPPAPPPKRRTRRPNLERESFERGSRALYEHPRYYDHAYRAQRKDIAFYVALARKARGPVLELGAGTGRITLQLARAGVEVVGVDRSRDMLARARQRASSLPAAARSRVAFRCGDMRSLRLHRRFALVLAPFNLFMHLYTRRDFERAIATVRAHLAPRGRFAMDVLVPDLGALDRDPARVYRCRPVFDPADGTRHMYGERYAYDPVRQVQTVQMMFQRVDRPEIERTTPLALRCYFPEELASLLHYNGVTVDARFGSFSGDTLDEHSEHQVLITKFATKR
jgi:SAM-dependent methyltransferase